VAPEPTPEPTPEPESGPVDAIRSHIEAIAEWLYKYNVESLLIDKTGEGVLSSDPVEAPARRTIRIRVQGEK
jgi:hypothetical protein